jgi:hypothetical protein
MTHNPGYQRFDIVGHTVPYGEVCYRCQVCGLIAAGQDARDEHDDWHFERGDYG